MHKLMIKTHNITGLKYLCYTQRENHCAYKGSGKLWRLHIKKHGYDVTTELVFQSELYDEFVKVAKEHSAKYDVVNNDSWANMRIEDGTGGDTVSNKCWITDGLVDAYHLKTESIPTGWRKGRSKCIFNDAQKQSEFSHLSSGTAKSEALKNAWESGKFTNRKPHKGVPHSEETKKILSKAALRRKKIKCEHCGNEICPGMYKRWHGEKCKTKL